MKRLRRYLLAGSLVAIILLAVFIALILGSRWLTASDAVRKRISAETARLTGGTLHYDRLALNLLPLPHLTALQVDFQLPGKVALKTESLAIYPDLAALAGGAIELGELVAVRPAARVYLTRAPAGPDATTGTAAGQRYRDIAAGIFGALSRLGPDLDLRVKGGTLALVRPDRPELTIDQIDLRLNSSGPAVALDLDCRSRIIERVRFKGKVNPETRNSSGRLRLDGLNARALMAELPPIAGMSISDTRLGLEVVFSAEAAEKVQARVACRVPEVSIQRQKRRLALQKILLKGSLAADPEKLTWDLKTIQVASHGLDLESVGTLAFGSRNHPAELELDAVGRQVDVAAVGRSFIAFAGDQSWVPTAFGVAREGILTRATCHLAIRQSGSGWAVSRIKAAGQLEKGLITIPGAELDLENMSGHVALVNQRVDFKQMKGRLPYGTFDRLAARIDWHRAATLTVSAPRGAVRLDKFYPWLTAFEGLKDLRRFVTTADGELALTQLELAGPLASPADWKIVVAADLGNVTLTSPELKGPLHVSRGRAVFKPEALSLAKLHLKYLDAEAVVSSKILGKPGQPSLLNVSLDGSIGGRTLRWMRRFIALPQHLKIQPPLKISGLDLQWDNRAGVTVTGEMTTGGGARVSADAAFAPGRWQVNRFELNDGVSDVSLKLSRSNRHVDLDYTGKLHQATLDRILTENKVLKGWLAGNIKASLDMTDLRSSQITGALRGEGLTLRRLPVSPIELERFSLNCGGKSLSLTDTDLVFAGTPMRLKGTAAITAQAYTFDLDLTADSLDAAALDQIRKEPSPSPAQMEAGGEKKLPINGVIQFKTPRFTFRDYTWSPVQANIAIRTDIVEVNVTRADLCGISTPGTITINADGLHLVFRPTAAHKDIQATWQCLQSKPLRADSAFSLIGTIETGGQPADLMKNLQGDVSFSSDDGMIHRSNILTKIFAFLNVTEVFVGKTSGLGEKGFGYDAIRAHAGIAAGTMNFDEILVDGHTMKISGEGVVNLIDETMNLSLLVAPLKTIDRLVKKMPVVGYITGGSILSVPVQIKGRTADPQVVPLPPRAVGRGLVGILERTLKTPLKVVGSLPEGDPQKPPQDDRGGGNSGSSD